MTELQGKVALVTGASRNIGRAIARELAHGGAAVVVNALRAADEARAVAVEIEAEGGKALAVLADVTNEDAVHGMMARIEQVFGRLDLLVNNAALRHEAPADALDHAAWTRIRSSILDSVFICSNAALPLLRQGQAARIVNISGMSASLGAQHRCHVIAAKAAVEGLTRALARSLRADGIAVNAISPGLIETVRAGGDPHHHRTSRTLVQRRGRPDEVAAWVRYLCGPAASGISGRVVHVNGGAYLAV